MGSKLFNLQVTMEDLGDLASAIGWGYGHLEDRQQRERFKSLLSMVHSIIKSPHSNECTNDPILSFIGGVDLTAQRRSDGLLYSYSDSSSSIADWPSEIQVGQITYTLEDISSGEDGYETAIYV